MSYQLVLQWPATEHDSFEALVGMEEALLEGLDSRHEVDGHDIGRAEMNIFVLTDDPIAAFAEAHRVLSAHPAVWNMRAAFRLVGAEDFTVVWPKGLSEFSVS